MVLHQQFLPLVKTLVDGSFIGSCFKSLEVRELQTSGPVIYQKDEEIFDHFKLHIPYAGYTLVWEVCFDSSSPDIAPDFVFDDDAFTSFLNANLLCERVPSLVNWDVENPECLRKVVQELINLYTLYQLQRLDEGASGVSEECSKFVQEFDIKEHQLQVLSGDFATSPHFSSSTRPPHDTVSVMILQLEKLVNFEGMPENYREMTLQLTFKEYSPTVVCLHASPCLMDVLGDRNELEIPNYTKVDGLSKYFHHLLKVLQETLKQIFDSLIKREELHLGLLYELQKVENVTLQPLEYDTLYFTSSSFMLEVDDFPVLVIVKTSKHRFLDPKVYVKPISGIQEVRIEASDDPQIIAQEIIRTVNEMRELNCSAIG